ncbi:MAG: prolyl oligopeptidase family serine peptidase [Gracilimonas sp.]|nr:prolyl oligopeptidase family serine peptidase [Gracilimonas sp.]
MFVHGAGSLQNVYKGWSNSYWREYMFHQFLTHQGYYVIEVDYRHSTGYGRKFREDVTNWMGKYETEDIEDGLAFLADNYDKADTSRVGIYGGSYGGFMALYAVGVSPEHFDAAAGLTLRDQLGKLLLRQSLVHPAPAWRPRRISGAL